MIWNEPQMTVHYKYCKYYLSYMINTQVKIIVYEYTDALQYIQYINTY